VKKATATPASAPPRSQVADVPEIATPAAPPTPPAAAGAVPSLDELAGAWGSDVLASLKPGTKAVFGTGHFVESEPGSAVFALANAPTRDHCEKRRPEVEAALAARFGRPVPLRLVTAAEAGGSPASAPAAVPATRAAVEDEEIVDVHALENAPTASSGVERLAEAFPGAKLVEEQ
jgi:hypothetical protein